MTVSCTVTGSGLGSGEEALCEDEVKTYDIKVLTTDGIAVRLPTVGNTVGSTEGVPLVEGEGASGKEMVPKGPPGKGWVLTA